MNTTVTPGSSLYMRQGKDLKNFVYLRKTLKNHVSSLSFNRLAQEKEELEQRHLHVIQILKSERACRWQYTQQCEELSIEIKKMRLEVCVSLITAA